MALCADAVEAALRPPAPLHDVELRREFGTVARLTAHVRDLLLRPGNEAHAMLSRIAPYGGRRRSGPWTIHRTPRGVRVARGGVSFAWRRACQGAILGRDVAKRRTARRYWDDAWRREVEPQIRAFRNVDYAAGLEVDHDPGADGEGRFMRLVDRFVEGLGGEVHVGGGRITDRAVAEAWRVFHKTHAKLRLVTPDANKRGNAGFRKRRRSGDA